MPFTPTHIAAALPIAWLCRWHVPFSALAIGCMVNDSSVFFPELFNYWTMHSALGVLTHCLPLGWLVYLLYHWLFKRPLCALLPRRFAKRAGDWVNRAPDLRPLPIVSITVCLIVGAASHVLWDSFTHENRWGVRQFPVLDQIAFTIGERDFTWYSTLQHGSTLVLLPPLLTGWIIWLLKQPATTEQATPDAGLLVKICAYLLCVIIPFVVLLLARQRYEWANQFFIIHQAVKFAGATLIALFIPYAIIFTLFSRETPLERTI